MAFGKKYFSSYKSNNNLDYYLEIFLEDYTGSALELVMGAGGPVIEYETDQEDRFSPIISSSCKIPYLVENYLDSLFIDDLRNNYQERQVYVHIYRSTQSGHLVVAPLWSGFLVMDIGSGVDKYFPYEEHLKFVDGLSLLKDIDFVDLGVSGGTPPFEERVQGNYAQENMYFGPATYIFWIREILAKSGAALTNQGASQNYGFTTSVNWYNGEMNATGQSSDPLHKTKCAVSMFHRKDDQGVFYPDNCYNVLKELLRHWGARITYWKHEFWIVQIPEYITSETGTISTPVNNNSRLYSNTGAYQGSQNHLGSTFYTRYEQTIQNDKISKLTGTKYDYLPIIKQVNADFLSFSSKSYFGGFPFGGTATTQEVFQGTINSPSAADFLYLSIPLDWTWDLSNAPNFPNGHSNGWWCAIKFNFYASDGTTTYYLQYNSAGGNYFWVDSALWTPLGNRAPKYIISSKLAVVTGHIGFEQQIPFEDENGNAISMSGAWSFFLDIEDYGTSSSNSGSFYLNFSGYGTPQRMRNPSVAKNLPTGTVPPNLSGTVSWSNTLQDAQGQVTISAINNPAGFNAGTVNPDIRFATTSPFTGLLQTLNNTQSASFGETFNVINSNTQAKQNSEQYNFGTLLWGDSLEFAPSSLQVFNGSTYVNTDANGEWGRGVLTGTKTFTEILIDEFFSGQTKIIISPSMRLAVGVANKNEDQSGTIRPRYVNPIGKLRETRDGTDPEYFFRRGSFYTLLDEWDYEGYQIIRNVPSTTTQSNGMGSMGGSQSGQPAGPVASPSPMAQALSQNSPLAYIRTTIPATGSNVAVNGNFNTAVGWTLGTGWSIDTTAKKAKFAATGSTSELTQSVLTQGLTYQVNFQVEVTAGTLLVKAGTSGTSQSITSSGDYSIYLDCEGSSLIKFQAGTTFTGNITYITLRDQKSLSSVPIEAIGTAVFKTGDTFNLINSNDDTILPLTVTSNQGSTDTIISVSSTPLYEDIDNGSYLLINQDDLSEQYQNKTKGTVAGFGIDADGISKGGIEITGWLNSDTMSGAAITNVPTALSVKNYVDGQVGASDTLQEVTDNGNTTTNSITFAGGTSTGNLLISKSIESQVSVNETTNNHFINIYQQANDSYIIAGKASGTPTQNLRFYTGGSEKMRLTSAGRLGIGTTSPQELLHINGQARFQNATSGNQGAFGIDSAGAYFGSYSNIPVRFIIQNGVTTPLYINTSGNVGINTLSPTEKLHVVGDALITGDSHADAFKPAATGEPIKFKNFGSTELARITDVGNLLIGTTVDSGDKLNINGSIAVSDLPFNTDSISVLVADETLGSELVTNGDFATDSDWIKESGWTINSGSANYDGVINIGSLIQNVTFIVGKLYKYTFTISNSTQGGVRFFVGNTVGIIHSTNGIYTGTIIYSSGSSIYIQARNSFIGSVDNVSVKEVTSASNQIQKRELGTGAFGPTPVGAYLPLTGGTLTGSLTGTTATFSGNVGVIGTGNLTIRNTSGSGSGIIFLDTTWQGGIEHSSGNLFFRTGGQTDKMVLRHNGNVLIGTTTDSGYKLNVNGTAVITDNLFIDRSSDGSIIFNTSGVNKFLIGYDSSPDGFRIYNYNTSSASLFIEKSTNNLGIGTTSPETLIHISKASSNSQLTLERTGSATGKYLIYTNTNNLVFNNKASNTYPFIIQNTGNVLIGTTVDSGSKLKVEYAGGSPSGIIVQSTSNRSKITVADNNTAAYVIAEDSFASYGMQDNLSANNLNINNLGNVGIGTTSPTKKLHINGDIKVDNGSILVPQAYGINFGQSGYDILMPSSTRIAIKTAGTEKLSVLNNGNLLLGTTTDNGDKLQVNGSIKSSSNIIADSYFESSDSNAVLAATGVGSVNLRPNGKFSTTGEFSVSTTATTISTPLTGTTATFSGQVNASQYSVGDTNAFVDRDGNNLTLLTYSGHNISIKPNNSESTSFLANGNVLIGTSTDSGDKFAVNGDISIFANKIFNGSSSNSAGISFASSTTRIDGYNGIIFASSTTGIGSQTERMRITNTGSVLIGTTVDSGDKLQVQGDITASGDIHSDKVVFTGTNNRIDASTAGTVKIITSGVETAKFTGTSSYLRNPNIVNTILLSGTKIVDTDRSLLNINNITTAGNVSIGGTVGAVYKLDVVGKQRVQSVLELDDVLTLNAISTPSDPASGKSSIYMDSADGAIKVKINVGGTVVTRTIASFE